LRFSPGTENCIHGDLTWELRARNAGYERRLVAQVETMRQRQRAEQRERRKREDMAEEPAEDEVPTDDKVVFED
jgi:hypothetical protein